MRLHRELDHVQGKVQLQFSSWPAFGIAWNDFDCFRCDAHAHAPLSPGSRNRPTEDVSDGSYDTCMVGSLSPVSFRSQSDLAFFPTRDHLHGRDALHIYMKKFIEEFPGYVQPGHAEVALTKLLGCHSE